MTWLTRYRPRSINSGVARIRTIGLHPDIGLPTGRDVVSHDAQLRNRERVVNGHGHLLLPERNVRYCTIMIRWRLRSSPLPEPVSAPASPREPLPFGTTHRKGPSAQDRRPYESPGDKTPVRRVRLSVQGGRRDREQGCRR